MASCAENLATFGRVIPEMNNLWTTLFTLTVANRNKKQKEQINTNKHYKQNKRYACGQTDRQIDTLTAALIGAASTLVRWSSVLFAGCRALRRLMPANTQHIPRSQRLHSSDVVEPTCINFCSADHNNVSLISSSHCPTPLDGRDLVQFSRVVWIGHNDNPATAKPLAHVK